MPSRSEPRRSRKVRYCQRSESGNSDWTAFRYARYSGERVASLFSSEVLKSCAVLPGLSAQSFQPKPSFFKTFPFDLIE